MTASAIAITDLSAQLYVELQRLTAAISLFRSYSAMAGFVPKTYYAASHVDKKQEFYTAEQWLADYFANKTGLIPSFLDMNQCIPPSPDAAAKMLSSFIEGLDCLPTLHPKSGDAPIGLIAALRAEIKAAEKSRKLRGISPIYFSPTQKHIALELVDQIESSYSSAIGSMRALHQLYLSS